MKRFPALLDAFRLRPRAIRAGIRAPPPKNALHILFLSRERSMKEAIADADNETKESVQSTKLPVAVVPAKLTRVNSLPLVSPRHERFARVGDFRPTHAKLEHALTQKTNQQPLNVKDTENYMIKRLELFLQSQSAQLRAADVRRVTVTVIGGSNGPLFKHPEVLKVDIDEDANEQKSSIYTFRHV